MERSLHPERSLPSRKSWFTSLLPYAAAVVLAFIAGYFARSLALERTGDERSGKGDVPVASSPAEDWTETFAEAYATRPGASRLARSLIAFSRALE
jgi:hypothetical protein